MLVVVVQLPDFGEVAHVQNITSSTIASQPDARRFSRKGLFGIICKQPPQDADPDQSPRPAIQPSPDNGRSKNQRATSRDCRLCTWSMQRCRMTISTTLAAFATHFWIIPFMKTSFLLVT